jgi:hypothetical protein
MPNGEADDFTEVIQDARSNLTFQEEWQLGSLVRTNHEHPMFTVRLQLTYNVVSH